jgi:DNA-directed RNA polymerase III subunit RPC1
MLLRPSYKTRVIVNLSIKERNYSGSSEHMCYKDGWVLIKNSELLAGMPGKLTLGSGGKGGLFFVVIRDNSNVYSNSQEAAARIM